jgi:hypothetical protein
MQLVMHSSPFAPHAPSLMPVTHVVPLQHPPLQMVVVPSHAVEHACVVGLQASLAGHAALVAQAQVPPKQPCDAPHEMQRPPFVPHAPAVSPVAQVPFEQHPPLHGVDDPHAVEHVPPLQARPGRQSDAVEHPHDPVGSHTRPIGLPAHEVAVHDALVSALSPPVSTMLGASPGASPAASVCASAMVSAPASPATSARTSPEASGNTRPSVPASLASWPSWIPKSDVHPAAGRRTTVEMAAIRRHGLRRIVP